jgi:hypothetical protein
MYSAQALLLTYPLSKRIKVFRKAMKQAHSKDIFLKELDVYILPAIHELFRAKTPN